MCPKTPWTITVSHIFLVFDDLSWAVVRSRMSFNLDLSNVDKVYPHKSFGNSFVLEIVYSPTENLEKSIK